MFLLLRTSYNDKMNSYIENSWNMIQFFKNYYHGFFKSESIIKDFKSGFFKDLDVENLFRFRVFLDSTLMLFNKEKLEKEYFKRNFQYMDFAKSNFKFDVESYYRDVTNIINEREKSTIFECINLREELFKDNPIIVFADLDIQNTNNNLKSNFEPMTTKFFDQVARLRNSFAHMQYGCFVQDEVGYMCYYGIYNKDAEILKYCGIVFERILHEFIDRFYSNHAIYGIPYKHSFFCNLDCNRKNSENLYYYEIKYKFNADIKYNVCDAHPMKSHVFYQNKIIELFNFIDSDSNFIIEEKLVEKSIILLVKSFKIKDQNLNEQEQSWFLKLLYDFETEFSNFILHLRLLVDVLIEHNYRLKKGKLDQKYRDECCKKLEELKEDEQDVIAFNTLFTILKLYTIMIRMEDDDLTTLKPDFIIPSKFKYEVSDLVDWCNEYYRFNDVKENDKENLPKYFLLNKIRNATAHGKINLLLAERDINIKFIDEFNSRRIAILVRINDFESMCQHVVL